MKQKILLSVTFAVIFSVLLVSSASAYVSLSFTSSTVPSPVEPGSKANLLLTISNAGNEFASSVELKVGSTTYVHPDADIFELATINAGGSIQAVVPLTISSDSPGGSVALPYTVSYSVGNAAGAIDVGNSASIVVKERTIAQITNVSYDKEIIQRGDSVKMTITVQNVGKGSMKDLVVALRNFSTAFAVAGTDTEKYVGNIPAGQTVSVPFDIIISNNADTITYSIPVLLTYYDDSGVAHSDTKYAGLKITGIPNFVVSLQKTENLFAGSKGRLTISIANIGTGTAKLTTAYASSDADISPKSNYIGNLDPDDTNSVVLDVNSVTEGKHNVGLTLSYKDSYNQEFSKSYSMDFNVSSTPAGISWELQVLAVVVVFGIIYWKRNSIFKIFRRE